MYTFIWDPLARAKAQLARVAVSPMLIHQTASDDRLQFWKSFYKRNIYYDVNNQYNITENN